MYAKINENNEVLQFPANPWAEHPEIGPNQEGRININNDIYVHVKDVVEELPSRFHKSEATPIVFENNEFILRWIAVPFTDEEYAKAFEEAKKPILNERNSLLYRTDWVFIEDSPLSEEEKQAMKEYRQKLRDIPNAEDFNPFNITWPTCPIKLPTPQY
jgi:hypothetical protein